MDLGRQFTSGNWIVKEGNEETFVQRWTEFTEWSKSAASGATSFFLIRDDGNPQHFLSFGGWDDFDSVKKWRQSPEFGERLGKCRELCDEFQAGDYSLSSQVG
jgi:heme-degrading monooxygenase HmoA